ncbi:MAG TPA: uracil-DNA glycosylase [Stellaceae bacterium]|jgi:uracil-DNA glycosylase family 4|nr:uracil-DNA glycosylase [Stellaceae bacterium]
MVDTGKADSDVTAPTHSGLAALLRWYVDMGADEAIAEAPANRLAPPPLAARGAVRPASRSALAAEPLVAPAAFIESPAESARSARLAAGGADTLAALEAAIAEFEGCALKQTATNTVIADGNPIAPVMIIGEAPGADEDRIGRPFVGRAGQLLDRMLAAIGLDRTGVLVTNVIYWRPPGNRTPTADEIAACLPFVLRHIALARPQVLVLAGATAARALLPPGPGITRLRGRWFELSVPGLGDAVPTLPMFHPSFLLRAPERKREAWRDLLALRARLDELLSAAP